MLRIESATVAEIGEVTRIPRSMIYRIDVHPRLNDGAVDPLGESIRNQIASIAPVGQIKTSRIFLLDTDEPAPQVQRIADELLADPIVERAQVAGSSTPAIARESTSLIEIHLKPGVMDPVAASTEMAIRDMGLAVRSVRTGRAIVIDGNVPREKLQTIAAKVLANGVIESVHFDPYLPDSFPTAPAYTFKLARVALLDLTDDGLRKLSRDGHLFLSLTEIKAVQTYFLDLGREPTDIELETIAQTWSEHCVHKTLKSAVDVLVKDSAGKVIGNRRYENLIKETIFDSTMQLMGNGAKPLGPASEFCLSVFKDNAGVVAFDDTDAVCFKVETHNHPSAIEPYGGAATGAGGCIRDVLGTGLSAKPIANTDIFCVAFPYADLSIANRQSQIDNLPAGVIHPRRVLSQVVAGVRDYGNRMGIPTVNGAVCFDDGYLANPLVFCGCVGLIPRDKIQKQTRDGDAIVVMGGRTGRDGIHGATFSSAELTDTHADEFSHAVQIGNAITQKKMADVILRARDMGLFTAVTDCGAGGLSSAVGEMGEKTGASVDLDKVPLKYEGLKYDEIWISEAQERMVLSVPRESVKALLDLSAAEDVEATVIGTFGTPEAELILNYRDTEVGRLSMHFLHKGVPMPTRKAVVTESNETPPPATSIPRPTKAGGTLLDRLLATLAHPNVASKHWIIRQYDHEVQGGSVIKPLTGPLQIGPSDAAVVRPKLDSWKGVALGCGLAPHVSDPYRMAIASIDEAVRNVTAVGARLGQIAILDNFCWPSVDDEITMGTLVRACEACRDAALAFEIPFISGKDSLHNQFTNQKTGQVLRIPNTLLISAMAVLEDVRRCVTMDLKDPRDGRVYLIGPGADESLAGLLRVHKAVAGLIGQEKVLSCHDVSDGGYLTAAAEMCIASGFGLSLEKDTEENLFAEPLASYLIEVHGQTAAEVESHFARAGISCRMIGKVVDEKSLSISEPTAQRSSAFALHVLIDELTSAWRGTLDW